MGRENERESVCVGERESVWELVSGSERLCGNENKCVGERD